jgi:hypothetical protein
MSTHMVPQSARSRTLAYPRQFIEASVNEQHDAPLTCRANNAFFLLRVHRRIRFSTGLPSLSTRPSSIDAAPFPPVHQIAERLAHVGLAQHPLALSADEGFNLDQRRFGAFLRGGVALRGRGAAGIADQGNSDVSPMKNLSAA